jgi:hypothetical protein
MRISRVRFSGLVITRAGYANRYFGRKNMKRAAILMLIIALSAGITFAADPNPEELLNRVDVSHPYYGNKVYCGDKVNVFHSKDKSVILVYQARYGGDGEHTENLLKLFKFQKGKGKKLLDQNIDSVEFVQEHDILKYIKGKYVVTLCDVCDGWEVSSSEDIFFIPIIIDIESLTVKSTLSEKEKKELVARLDQQSDKDIAEQLSYGNNKYPAFISIVKKQIKDLLRRK